MRKLMDTVIFGDGGSRIIMRKLINVGLSDTQETN